MSGADKECRKQLLAYGDGGKIPRDTRFYFYDGDLTRLEGLAKAQGFAVHPTAANPGLILQKTLAVDELSFAPVAALMAQWAEETGAEYDGWECAVTAVH